ncbi:hypothetical protein Ami103574_13085 [Aminipila butyrica]|uniref:5-bromo-4-chloroindolyl phosphate hydrolysis protein n=1 Tax=Aminipila butyrica TaxID=433296 RepID=A0A858BYH3_9FIRM|nr:5-bromo-4-chloroindolyl phosphate hydrolysis family protein [Aminipila butyrica]QIB70168.1 hypothetical protein Ami103574_13085 [Aminipila butyrica]
MKNDNFIDFGEEIGRTVRKVLNNQEFHDLKRTINRTMNGSFGQGPFGMGRGSFGQDPFNMGGGPFYGSPQDDDAFPRLSKDRPMAGTNGMAGKAFDPSRLTPLSKVAKKEGAWTSTLFVVLGILGSMVSGLLVIGFLGAGIFVGKLGAMSILSFLPGIPFVFSLWLTSKGFQLKSRRRRFQQYQAVLSGRSFCTIEELAVATGQESKYIIQDLRKMIKAGVFKEGYLDVQETCLMTDYKTYCQYLESAKSAKERQEVEKQEQEKWADHQALRETIMEGKSYIQTIKAANDALPELEISQKLDNLELVTVKIFDYVEEHPEKLPEIRKFMCYYMPITLKLVKAYQQFDEHAMADVEEMKKEIKGTLDTINLAYQNLLKKLMQTDILDISSDISALETILAQEGLTENEMKGPGGISGGL